MSKAEYDALPDRQGFEGVPAYEQWFRDTAHPTTVFQAMSKDWLRAPHWWAFKVDIT